MPMHRPAFRLACLAMLAALFPAPALLAQSRVTVVAPERGATSETRALSGGLVALQASALSPRIAGIVASLAVDAGDRVRRGQEILRLDDELARLDAARAHAAVAEGRALAEEARRVATESAELAEQRNIARTQARAAAAEAEIGAAALASREAEAALAAARLERHVLRAPFDGVVAARHVDIGEWVEAGGAVVDLVAGDQLRFDIRAPQELWTRIDDGARVEVRLDALPERSFPARVAARVPVSDPATRSFLLRLELEAGDAALTPGMSGQASFDIGGPREAWTLPRDAIQRYPDGGTAIWVVEQGESGPVARSRRVELAGELGERVAVRSGLDGGERVVVRGNERLRDGEPVAIVEGG